MKYHIKSILAGSVCFLVFLSVGSYVLKNTKIGSIIDSQSAATIGSSDSFASSALEMNCNAIGYNYIRQWGVLGSGNSQFNAPLDVASDSLGNIYVADTSNNRIQKFDARGNYITQWGALGKANGKFNKPSGITVDSAGNVYVVDKDNQRVQKFTADGAFILKWGPLLGENGKFSKDINDITTDSVNNVYVTDGGNNRVVKFTSTGTYITKFGGLGTGNGKFKHPYGITSDSSDNIYVTDNLNNRVQKFSALGLYVAQWGTLGNGNGEFNLPYGISSDSEDNIFVVDGANNRIQKFGSGGGFITKFGIQGIGNGEIQGARGVVVGDNDAVYVADTGNNRIQEFAVPCSHIVVNKQVVPFPDASDFAFARSFGPNFLLDHDNDATLSNTITFDLPFSGGAYTIMEQVYPKYTTFLSCVDPTLDTTINGSTASIKVAKGETVVCDFRNTCNSGGTYKSILKWGELGNGNGQLHNVQSISVDSADNIYVVDTENSRIQKFNSNGVYISQFGFFGTAEGQFIYPSDMDFDSTGNIYVADGVHRVQKFDPNGVFKMMWGWGVNNGANQFQTCTSGCEIGIPGSGAGQLDSPSSISVGLNDDVYVGEAGSNSRIQKFTSDGNYLLKFGGSGTTEGKFSAPYGMVTDATDNVYVNDGHNRIQKFDSNGDFQIMWGWGVKDGLDQLETCTSMCQVGIPGNGDGQLSGSTGLGIDRAGNIYAASFALGGIQKFDSNGNFITKWETYINGPFVSPRDVAIDSSGYVYTTESGPFGDESQRIQKFGLSCQ